MGICDFAKQTSLEIPSVHWFLISVSRSFFFPSLITNKNKKNVHNEELLFCLLRIYTFLQKLFQDIFSGFLTFLFFLLLESVGEYECIILRSLDIERSKRSFDGGLGGSFPKVELKLQWLFSRGMWR